ncbi:MAG: phosphoenolpyruvate carboxylase [Pseudomonadota bacterium]
MTTDRPDDSLDYAESVIDLLEGHYTSVVKRRCPEIPELFDVERDLAALPVPSQMAALQATGIWFHLLRIADENIAMCERRQFEKVGGPDTVRGSFSNIIGEEQLIEVLDSLDVGPTLTAHPTEAKRVTVLEIHRRIYRKLVDLEVEPWTPRERRQHEAELLDQIDLLWMTGEIRLERPTVETEVAWGMHFFRESLFDAVDQLYASLGDALKRHFPEHPIAPRPFLRFSSWIGGDRDGNPNVTCATTRHALDASRQTAIERYRSRLHELITGLSVSSTIMDLPEAFQVRLRGLLAQSGDADELQARNPRELFRQYFGAIDRRLAATGGREETGAEPYKNPSELVDDLDAAAEALRAIAAPTLALSRVVRSRPSAFAPSPWTSARTRP